MPGLLAVWLAPFACLFTRPTWGRVPILIEGALLAVHRRTISAALRAAGRDHASDFARYHRVLNQACWSARAAAHVLLGLLVAAFVPSGPVVIGVDDTLERRWGKRITARGIYRDPVRSSHGHFTQGERAALGVAVAPGPDLLGRSRLVAAIPDHAGALGTACPGAGPHAQEADRLG